MAETTTDASRRAQDDPAVVKAIARRTHAIAAASP